MIDAHLIKQSLFLQQLPAYEPDIPYIQHILNTVKQAEESLNQIPNFNWNIPLTIVDKRLIR